ncbi:MAG: NAD-binding protein [Paracoccaceae bacterium]
MGTGLAMKVINNGLLQGAWAALVDVVQIAKRSGISLEKTLDILGKGPAVNPMMKARIPKMLGEDTIVGFNIHGAVKDSGVFVNTAHRLGLEAPTLSIARDIWNRSLEADRGESDVADLISLAYDEA